MSNFKVGDEVVIKSELGLHMVVAAIVNDGKTLECIYFNRLTAMFVRISQPAECFKPA